MEHIHDMIIIGGGPGGYTAALYGARAGLDTLSLENTSPGGQMALSHQIDNYPGFEEGIDGFSLGMKMQQGAERFGVKTVMTEVLSVNLQAPLKRIETDSGAFFSRTVVLATGAGPRPLGVEGEERFVSRGIHYCAACDGMFYRGKTVLVVGGGNTAAADALLLSRVAKKVILVHRRDTLRATKIYHAPLMQAENVELHWNSTVSALLEDENGLSGVRLRDVHSGAESDIACDGVFVSIGRNPATALFREQVSLDGDGYVIADESTRTNLPGVFAVGDIRTKVLRQIITAASDGAMAAFYAEEYLAEPGANAG
ncbi:MAG: thioredoxin-disulfide reductase [Clostridia bacterium]|nr:thioredoxin-disulfide reductase [Clostridia bacterium]